MPKLYVDIEHQILQEDFFKFKELADLLHKSLKDTIEMCMFEKRDELLQMLKHNIPEKEESDGHSTTTSSPEERAKEKAISN